MNRQPTAAQVEDGLVYALEPRLAVHYERHLLDCGYRSHVELAACAVATMGAATGRWLDLGAGSGLVGRALAALGSSAELTAIDLSASMLELIEERLYAERVRADCADRLPLPPASFSGALAAGLLEHVVDAERLFANVARLLVPGGGFLFTYPPNDAGGAAMADADQGLVSHDVAEVNAHLLASGFALRSEREYPAYHNGSQGWMVHRLVACALVR